MMHNGWQEKELASGCRFNDIERSFSTIYNERNESTVVKDP